jgi:hypothetical protein
MLQSGAVCHLRTRAPAGHTATFAQTQSKGLNVMCRNFQGDGSVPGGAGKLQEVSLAPDDWWNFQRSVAELAKKSELRAGHFENYQASIEKSGHTVFLDAANIAYYGNSCKPGLDVDRFQWLQVKAVYEEVVKELPGQLLMVVTHCARLNSRFLRNREADEFVRFLKVPYPAAPSCLLPHICTFCVFAAPPSYIPISESLTT